MAKLSPKVKYGCSKCRVEFEKLEKEIADLDIVFSELPVMKQTTLKQQKPKTSSKVVSLF